MSTHLQLIARGLVGLAVAQASHAGAQPPPQSVGQIRLVEVDFASLSDREYASLIDIIADSVPVRDWPTILIEAGDGLERIVDRAYDLYSVDHRRTEFSAPHPESAHLLVDRISTANAVAPSGLVAGQELRIPPVPPRPKTLLYDSPTRLLFAPGRSEALAHDALSSAGDASRSVPDTYYTAWTWTPAAPETAAWEARGFRNTALTTFVVDEDAADRIVAAIPTARLLPIDRMAVELIQQRSCGSEQSSRLLTHSPYLRKARQRLANARAELARRAAGRELVLIDSRFTSGHGADVLRAAEWLLTELGVPELHPYVWPYEISPLAAEDGQTRLFEGANIDMQTQHKAYYDAHRGDISGDAFKDGVVWLAFADEHQVDLTIAVPPTVLQSAIWSQLAKGRWLNLSWRAWGGRALPEDWPQHVENTFVVVAAGNESNRLQPDVTPQDAASRSRHFTNVTHGSADGHVYGTSTGPSRVDLAAPGCFAALSPGMEGSSFASPVVAASAWLKHLLDGTPASAIREQLIRSSSLLPTQDETTRSQGFFDPARLIAGVGPHYRARGTDTITSLRGQIELSARECTRDFTVTTDDPRRGSRDVIVYEHEGTYLLVMRTTNVRDPDVTVTEPCSVTELMLTATDASGAELLRISSPREFAESIVHLTF